MSELSQAERTADEAACGPQIVLDDGMRLALKLLDKAPENALLMLPCGPDNALRGLEHHGLAEITETVGVPLASITPLGREVASRV
jgi:hypothetical protein